MDFPDIPDFLRIPQAERMASWKGKRLTKANTSSVTRTRNEDASTRAFRRELERQRKAKQEARFKMLRERKAETKRAKIGGDHV